MAAGNPRVLSPPIADEVEIDAVTFDFGTLLTQDYSGTSITAIDAINVTCVVGVDPDPSSRKIGEAIIVQSPSEPAVAEGAVVAWFGTMIGGCTYLLQVVVSLSDGISHPSVEVRLPCYST